MFARHNVFDGKPDFCFFGEFKKIFESRKTLCGNIRNDGSVRQVKVVGIDGTPQGLEGLKNGKLFGTVICDSKEYADVIFEIAAAEALGQNVQEKVELKDEKYYQCGQKALTGADFP